MLHPGVFSAESPIRVNAGASPMQIAFYSSKKVDVGEELNIEGEAMSKLSNVNMATSTT